ncbi:MAG: peptide ABC transporter ATP-binding protein [Spirochaeta sp. LUC14_002_19_P3]|nr:MAG: peptide ABC transporter ATP-binding protein [Spirochaeta sp. LUC14_002_19_P3]
MKSKFEIENLTKYYGNTQVLDNISLSVGEHEVVCLIGASGSGKSTVLRCASDLVPFEQGCIRLNGQSIHDENFPQGEIHKQIGIVFQSYNLFPHIKVIDNITLAPRRVHKRTKRESEEHARELLSLFELSDYADSYPEQLSGGQQQRVAIIRAMANKPDILLLDEITAALDPELIGGVLSVIKNLRKQGMTMLVVTHEMGFARDLADRVCYLHQGKIVEEATPEKLFVHPEHPRTQQFLQSIIESGRLQRP